VPSPSHAESRRGKDEKEDSISTSVIAHTPGRVREGAFGNATSLVCRECGATQELGPYYACPECFGPLQVGYDFP
jgi:threonine synthase